MYMGLPMNRNSAKDKTKWKLTCFLYPLQKSVILTLVVLLGMVAGVALSFPRPDDPYHKPVYHTPSHKGRVKMQVRKNKRKGTATFMARIRASTFLKNWMMNPTVSMVELESYRA